MVLIENCYTGEKKDVLLQKKLKCKLKLKFII